MKSMGVNEIREKFLSFFESKGCLRLGSFPLIPKNDASLLLINSGMAPMKPWFQNPETAPKRRVTTCLKCIRTGDIENVGKTARHGTFFEMLGNFSFGDYFKKEATAWAWEFFTKVMEIPQERLWISVYEEDDEARDIWVNEVGVDPTHIVKLGKEDNFWEHGTGPCGPCSEIYFDRGEEYGRSAVSVVNVTDLWKFGTLYLRSSTRTRTATITVYRTLTLIRVWVLKDLPLLCKVLTIFLRLTLFKTL